MRCMGRKDFKNFPELWLHAVAIHARTFDRCRENGIHGDASMADFFR